MIFTFSAMVDDKEKRKKLCKRIKSLGHDPEVKGTTVFLVFEGDSETALKIVGLFEQFPYHGACMVDKTRR